MGYIIRIKAKDGRIFYIKRTANFGRFHGSIYVTEVEREARVWSKYCWAKDKSEDFMWRVSSYGYDYDRKKFPFLIDSSSEVIGEHKWEKEVER